MCPPTLDSRWLVSPQPLRKHAPVDPHAWLVIVPPNEHFRSRASCTEWSPGKRRSRATAPREDVVQLSRVLLIGAGSCRGRSQSRWSARSAARTYDLDCDLCAARECPARGGRPGRFARSRSSVVPWFARRFTQSPRCARVSASERGQGRTAWRAEGVPLKPLVEKVVTG
jgi:hypothetical protein